ncbi:MAG TPA: enoyl-CoA hydratase/isomerase family protein [Burkholderiales bacterium]|nr:enoyl-CoA hydratase/isomerase family protein [Burkholderiales bacterium]
MLERRRVESVKVLALDREAMRNALDLALARELAAAIVEAAADSDVGALLLAGNGAGFCSGSDVKEMARASVEERIAVAREKGALVRAIADCPKPVVAAVQGFALGGGFMLAAACDYVVTTHDARWRLPEVGLGFFPPWGIDGLVARVGVARARALVFGHETLDGRRAVEFGVADLCVEPGHINEEALRTAQHLSSLPGQPVLTAKRFFAPLAYAGALDERAIEAYRMNMEAGAADASFSKWTKTRPE